MTILGIRNRTENWKTVEHFHFINEEAKVKLVEHLLTPYGNTPELDPSDITIELFWEGMRDYKGDPHDHQLATCYASLFPELRTRVEEFTSNAKTERRSSFRDLKPWNYRVSEEIFVPGRNNKITTSPSALKSNLLHTEIDIVVETPDHLLIGEAKDESSLNSSSTYVLVHQLVRQYVMAKMLVKLSGKSLTVVPFVVGTDVERLNNSEQVRFLQWQKWLMKENVLSWDAVSTLHSA